MRLVVIGLVLAGCATVPEPVEIVEVDDDQREEPEPRGRAVSADELARCERADLIAPGEDAPAGGSAVPRAEVGAICRGLLPHLSAGVEIEDALLRPRGIDESWRIDIAVVVFRDPRRLAGRLKYVAHAGKDSRGWFMMRLDTILDGAVVQDLHPEDAAAILDETARLPGTHLVPATTPCGPEETTPTRRHVAQISGRYRKPSGTVDATVVLHATCAPPDLPDTLRVRVRDGKPRSIMQLKRRLPALTE